MATFNIDLAQLQLVFLVFVRLSAIVMTLPVFSSKNVPVVFKAGLVLSITLIVYPLIDPHQVPFDLELLPFVIGIASEILLGVLIGLTVNLIFSGVQLGGQLVGYQMGFAIANVMDPQSGSQASIISIMLNLTAMLLFLVFNAHHWFFAGLVDSFSLIPIFSFTVTGSLTQYVMNLGGNMFIIAIKVAAPVMAALLLASICLGLIARTVPKMNVFLVGMPLKIGLGFLLIGFSLPYFASFLRHVFSGVGQNIVQVLKAV